MGTEPSLGFSLNIVDIIYIIDSGVLSWFTKDYWYL